MTIFKRNPQNPIIVASDIKPSRSDWRVEYVINAGVITFNNETLLLLRVAEGPISNNYGDTFYSPCFDSKTGKIEYHEFDRNDPLNNFDDPRFVVRYDEVGNEVIRALSTISHLRVATSADGVNFSIMDTPAMFPANQYEQFGIEDPRITFINGKYYINYSAISPSGDATALAVTTDFINFERLGVIFTPDNKDICIFPRKINGKYYALNRPASEKFGAREMWISESSDLVRWGNHKLLYSCSNDDWGDSRNGCGAVPIETDRGWLEIYHAADRSDRYCLGALLLDINDPSKVIGRTSGPLFEPKERYELEGVFGNVVFCCGAVVDPESQILRIYYGAADTVIAMAETPLNNVLNETSML